ncbi:UNVERIFIED_CONTAM: protein Brevis radix-like 4 [Sesamum latifolium]|uniref:Protein Brevis radix-like 4 n=1 Tax=Sesamum latifolium TaxID=2727402 RepID=A0AAW2VBJ8_9LAMI
MVLLLNKPLKPSPLRSRIWHLSGPTACAPRAAQQRSSGSYEVGESDAALALDKFRWSYRRTGSSSSNSSSSAGRRELEARLKGISSGEGRPASASGRRVDPVVFVEESEPKGGWGRAWRVNYLCVLAGWGQ